MLLSVVIPAYNCAQKIGPTLESVLAQDWPSMEILVVDDGSTDGTGGVIDGYAQRDSRVRPIHIENAGPSNARNVGIREAKGDYVTFVDSDDLLQPGMYRAMMELAEAHDLDEAACGYTMENVSGGKASDARSFTFPDFVARTPEEFREKLIPLIQAHLMYVVWNKVYRLSLLRENGIELPLGYHSGEDRYFNAKTLPHIRRFGFLSQTYYRYLVDRNGLNNKYLENRFEAALDCHLALTEAFREMGAYDEAAEAALDFQFVKGVMSCFTQLCGKDCPLNGRQKKEYIRRVLSDSNVASAIRKREGEGGYSKIVNRILRSGKAGLALMLARGIYFMQNRLNSLFLRIKHGK